MIEERDIAGFALPFAAGAYFTTGCNPFLSACKSSTCILFLVATILLATLLSHPFTRAWGGIFRRTAVAAAGFFCGCFTGASDMIMNISATGTPHEATRLAEILAGRIDNLKFEQSTTSPVIKALITGDRKDIPEAITEAFRNSGGSHILALSGFHLGIIYSIIAWTFRWTGGNRKTAIFKSISLLSLCGIYTVATGAGPSIVRAFIFILLRESAAITLRKPTTASLLFSALIIHLTISPSSIHSVSFQLSYAAMAGIAFIFPHLDSFWPDDGYEDNFLKKLPKRIWTSAALSISCQITTGPLAYHYFGTFPEHFLITNLIAIPLTGLIIPAALLALTLDGISACPEFISSATDILVTALFRTLETISEM